MGSGDHWPLTDRWVPYRGGGQQICTSRSYRVEARLLISPLSLSLQPIHHSRRKSLGYPCMAIVENKIPPRRLQPEQCHPNGRTRAWNWSYSVIFPQLLPGCPVLSCYQCMCMCVGDCVSACLRVRLLHCCHAGGWAYIRVLGDDAINMLVASFQPYRYRIFVPPLPIKDWMEVVGVCACYWCCCWLADW